MNKKAKALLTIFKKEKCNFHKEELPFFLFLVDWRSIIVNKKSITELEWFIDHRHLPLSPDFDDNISEVASILFNNDEEEVISHVINFFKNNDITKIHKIVRSTYPLLTSDIGDKIDWQLSRENYHPTKRQKRFLTQ